jgi:hypothetical protein
MDIEGIIQRLRSFKGAYPEDIFQPFTDIELKAYTAIITRASAGMGRHFEKVFAEIADQLESCTDNGPEVSK